MEYQTFQPHKDLSQFVKYYWTLKVPKEPNPQKQRIVPDGSIEMIFTLGDDVKRYVSDTKHIIQPRSMVLGQITEPFYIEPMGTVDTFAVCFFPGGFMPFTKMPIKELENRETELKTLLGEKPAADLEHKIIYAANIAERIQCAEAFLTEKLKGAETINSIVTSTIDLILSTKGRTSIHDLLKDNPSKRRQLERRFSTLTGLSPKQLARIIRFQTALKMLLNNEAQHLSDLAYENEYYDQAHFIKDFKAFTGTNPKKFYKDEELLLSSAFYTKKQP